MTAAMFHTSDERSSLRKVTALTIPTVVLIFVTIASMPVLAADPVSRPNILLIMTDDQGYGDLSCHGNPHLKTPRIDQLYRESLRFTDFHVSPTCAPTRSALMTGR